MPSPRVGHRRDELSIRYLVGPWPEIVHARLDRERHPTASWRARMTQRTSSPRRPLAGRQKEAGKEITCPVELRCSLSQGARRRSTV